MPSTLFLLHPFTSSIICTSFTIWMWCQAITKQTLLISLTLFPNRLRHNHNRMRNTRKIMTLSLSDKLLWIFFLCSKLCQVNKYSLYSRNSHNDNVLLSGFLQNFSIFCIYLIPVLERGVIIILTCNHYKTISFRWMLFFTRPKSLKPVLNWNS